MCVALAALEAVVIAEGPNGERRIAFSDFHRLPGDTPNRDTNLDADELITAIELPAKGFSKNYTYIKIRDRLSFMRQHKTGARSRRLLQQAGGPRRLINRNCNRVCFQ